MRAGLDQGVVGGQRRPSRWERGARKAPRQAKGLPAGEKAPRAQMGPEPSGVASSIESGRPVLQREAAG